MKDDNYKERALRWFKGKQLLAEVRGGNYAHAGEEEAIKMLLGVFPKGVKRKILDVGCGLGGTANFIQAHGWGEVVGIDIDRAAIGYAKAAYPNGEFHVCDACDASAVQSLFPESKFDIIILFHALCVFPNQHETIAALRKLAHQNTVLAIFEYEDLGGTDDLFKNTYRVASSCFHALSKQEFKSMLHSAGWKLEDDKTKDLAKEFLRWYEQLLQNLDQKKEQIISKFGDDYFNLAKQRYGGMLEAVKQGILGGCIIYAVPAPTVTT